MVEFIKDIVQKNNEFAFKAGKRYPSMEHPDDTNKILILQPNSPKNRQWWTSFPKTAEGDLFKTLKRQEMTPEEIRMEDNIL